MNAQDRFFQALAFLTIMPVRARQHDATLFAYARDFPLVGVVIGLLSGGVYYIACSIWEGLLPASLAIVASLIATGALHEDGLADTADGFGGGWTREQRLAIMKDSRLGTYGVLALGLSVALRTCALAMLAPNAAFFGLIAVHAGARLMPVLVLASQNYAGDRATAKASYQDTRLASQDTRYALLWAGLAVLPILVLRPTAILLGIVLGGSIALALALYSKRAIGGYCGDVLGAIEQLFEIGCLLGLAA